MAVKQARKVASVPAVLEPSTMYLVETSNPNIYDVSVSNATATAVKHAGLKSSMFINRKILVA